MPLTPQQKDQLTQDVAYMHKANMSDSDIEAYMDEQLSNWGVGTPHTELPTGQLGLSGSKSAAAIAGPMIGGSVASSMASRMSPLAQTAAEGAGITLGDIAGRAVSGQPENLKESLLLGGGSAALGGLYRGMTKVMGGVGGVPRVLTQEAGSPAVIGKQVRIGSTDVPVGLPLPNVRKVMLAAPRNVSQVEAGISPERTLADRAANAAKLVNSKLTPERAQKVMLLKQAGDVDAMPIVDALSKHVPANPLTDESVAFGNRLTNTIDRLTLEAGNSGGRLPATRVDEIIRTELSPKIYTKSGQVADTKIALAYADAEEAAKTALDSAIPDQLRPLNQKISAKLRLADRATRLFGGDKNTSIASISNAYQPGNEKTAEAIRFLSDNTDKSLSREAMTLATRRAFAGDIRTPARTGSFSGIELRTPFREAARVMAPLQPFAGGTTAAMWKAFIEKQKVSPHSEGTSPLVKQTSIAPEEIFKGLTNAPPQEQQ